MTSKAPVQPAVEFATGQAVIKGEDVIFVRPRVSFPKSSGGARLVDRYDKSISDSASSVHATATSLQSSLPLEEQGGRNSSKSLKRDSVGSLQGTGSFGLFCVFDGHNGVHAAEHLEETVLQTLEEKLPAGHPPAEGDEPAYTRWREELQRALIETFCDLNEAFACKGVLAGTTVTVVLQYGWLLTVASCGDSRALLDTGSEVLQLTVDHRISTHKADRHRLESLGAQIAPIDASGSGPAVNSTGYGPLRVWPGGLCLSRGIGDFDIGPPVIACPHIYQVRVPDTGARLIVASDGVWDGFENMKRLSRMSRKWPCQAAPNKVIQALQRAFGGLRDDTSLVVLDIMPPGSDFAQHAQQTPKRQNSSGSSCFCFAAQPEEQEQDVSEKPAKAEVLVDLDVATAVGLMPGSVMVDRPSWCDPAFCKAVCGSQVAACNAWNEARSMRSMGKTPSRQDLASFFSAVYQIQPLSDGGKAIDPHDLDISTRPDLFGKKMPVPAEDITVHPRSAGKTLAEAAARTGSVDGKDQGDASIRFREHVADQKGFARKFGHYKNHMDSANPSEEGSTTEDDSLRAGSQLSSPADSVPLPSTVNRPPAFDWQSQAVEAGWAPPPTRPETASDTAQRPRTTLYSLDSAMARGLPTVEEDPIRKGTLEGNVETEVAAEMAVRRGKNRFMKGGSTVQDGEEPVAGKPPLPGRPASTAAAY